MNVFYKKIIVFASAWMFTLLNSSAETVEIDRSDIRKQILGISILQTEQSKLLQLEVKSANSFLQTPAAPRRDCRTLLKKIEKLENMIEDRQEEEARMAEECEERDPPVPVPGEPDEPRRPVSTAPSDSSNPDINCDDLSWFDHFDVTMGLQQELLKLRLKAANCK